MGNLALIGFAAAQVFLSTYLTIFGEDKAGKFMWWI
jgi:hypothetical protein